MSVRSAQASEGKAFRFEERKTFFIFKCRGSVRAQREKGYARPTGPHVPEAES